MIMFKTYINQFTCSHHGIIVHKKITTYLDAKGTSKKTFLLCEQLIQDKTPDFKRIILYERVKLFTIQLKIGDFHKDFYIQQIEKLAYHRSYYNILGKYHVSDIRHKAFESTPGDISNWSDYAERFTFEPGGELQNECFDNNLTLSMEGCCLDIFRITVNASNFYDNGGGYVHQSNYKLRKFHLNLYYSKLQNAAKTSSCIHTLLARMFEKNKW